VKLTLKLRDSLLGAIHRDLDRRHAFASERVGFLMCKPALTSGHELLLFGCGYLPVDDAHYLNERWAGAVVGHHAFRKARQAALTSDAGIFHVHKHLGRGPVWFSGIDLRESKKFVPDFVNVRPDLPHGAVVLNTNSAAGLCWLPSNAKPAKITEFWAVGSRVTRL
jgi:hypothetical protein